MGGTVGDTAMKVEIMVATQAAKTAAPAIT